MMANDRRAKPVAVSDLLLEAFRGKPLEKRLKEARVWGLWEQAVGPQVARQARPVKFGDGILTVAVATSPWMHQLSLLKPEIVSRINEAAGETVVGDLFLKHGIMKKEAAPVQAARKRKELSPIQRRSISDCAAVIGDPDLRRRVASCIAALASTSAE
ncbi:MAG TPA: DUF721 domain-containing protein [Verrucomicrobiae bacterium]|nr:DUF721 domain-containing protein [Verrucomicrobiae bacterium]